VTSKPDFKVMVLLLVFMQLTRDLFAIAKFLFFMREDTRMSEQLVLRAASIDVVHCLCV